LVLLTIRWRFKTPPDGRKTLFCTEQEAKEYIEKSELMRWISTFSFAPVDDYTVEELRKVRGILDKSKKEKQ